MVIRRMSNIYCNTEWNDVNCGNTNEMSMWPSQWIAISAIAKKPEKRGFRGFNGIRTNGLCVSAAVLYQPELWRPIHWRPANLLRSSTRERNETQNEMMWTAGIQMKWVCDHRSESQFKQLRKSPKKRDSNPVEAPKSLFFGLFRNCLNCD